MQKLIAITILSAQLFADFTLFYKLDDNFTQEVNFKDPSHVLFTFRENNQIFQKLLIDKDNKYLSLYDQGIETIYQIDDSISEPISKESKEYKPTFKIIQKEANITYRGYLAQKWLIDDNGKKEELIVSNEPKLVNAVNEMIKALKKLLPNNKQKDAHIFNAKDGYVVLQKEKLEFLDFFESKLNYSLFTINQKLSKKEQQDFSSEIDKCFFNLCCGQQHTSSTTISNWLEPKVDNWILSKSAKCKQINSVTNFENALYEDNNTTIVIEMTTSNQKIYGKIESLKEQGIKIDNIQKSKINGFNAQSAYLPFINSTVIDISLPHTTFSIYQKGKTDLIPFAKKAIKFSRISKK